MKTIGQEAFSNCYDLSSVILYNGLDSIGDNAFEFCQSLRTITIPASFKSEDEATELVRISERDFDRRLTQAAEAVSAASVHEGVKILRLSGPSCAGKTTCAKKLTDVLEAAGREVYPISLDDFFHDRNTLFAMAQKNGGKLDYDSVDALDLDLLHACVQDLMTTGKAGMPSFNFKTGLREGPILLDTTQGKSPVFLFEGIQAVYPKVVDMLDGAADRSIFMCVRSAITVGDVTFEPNEIRLMRRLVRDESKRGAVPEFTLHLWHSVRENEENSIFPEMEKCDMILDSTMPFEIHMLKPHVERIFSEHPVQGEDAPIAQTLLSKLSGVQAMSHEYLSENSLYHEFILA